MKYADRQSDTDLLQDECGGIPLPRRRADIQLVLTNDVYAVQFLRKLSKEPCCCTILKGLLHFR